MRKLFALFLLTIMLFGTVLPVEACHTTPPSTPSSGYDCEDLGNGYKLGFRITGAKNGEYKFTPAYGKLTGGAPVDPAHGVTISRSDGKSFSWASNIGIDAVIVSTTYKPRVYRHEDLTSGNGYKGTRDSRGRYYPVTSVEFCYNYKLTATQTATGTTGGRLITWDITKTMTPASQVKFAGEAAKFDYTVAVVKTTTGSSQEGTSITGTITVSNETPVKAYLTDAKVRVNPGWLKVTLNCGDTSKLRIPYPLYPGKSVTCTYELPLKAKLDNATVSLWVMTTGTVAGVVDTIPVEWTEGGEVTGGYDTITVTDSQAAFGGPYTVSESTTWSYSVDMPCPTDPAAYTNGQWAGEMVNTAAITETGQSASQTAALQCYVPLLSQTAGTSLSRQYLWGIDKFSPVSELLLEPYNSEYVDYTVTMSVAGTQDTNLKITGSVTVANPNPTAALTGDLAGQVAPDAPLTLTDCTNPVTIPAAGSLTCNFEAVPPTSAPGASTATFSFNSLNFTTSVPYDFNNGEKTETDRCVTVTDDKYGELGTTCVDDLTPFSYYMEVGGYTRCGMYTFLNTASFVTNDTRTTGEDTWTINIPMPCETNCVTDAGWWAYHSDPTADPASNRWYDETWNQVLPSGPSSPFFESGDTWISAFGRNAKLSAYYAMAHEYMAAQLNVYRGADASQVSEAMAQAAALLEEYDTHQADVTGEVLAQFNALKTQLNTFNKGNAGPEPCCY
jgi:hypothetical protein